MKSTRLFCVMAVMLIACAFTSSAADFEVDGIFYNVIGTGEVEVAQYDSIKYAGEIIVPATVLNDGITYQVKRIGNRAFYICPDLTLIDIPEGVTSIGEYAFYNCTALQSIDFPNSLVSIEKRAFYSCKGLTGFYITRNVANIHEEAFNHCIGVTSYLCNSMNAHYKSVNGVLYSKDLSTIVAYPPAAPATSFDIPQGVTRIGGLAFFSNQNLVNVNIPENVTWIGYAAFGSSLKLASIDIPDGVTYMGKSAFINCADLTSVHLPAGIDSIFRDSFAWCPALTEITIPRNVKFIDEFVFNESGIKTITFEEGSCLNYIGNRTFEFCRSLESFDMPNSVTSTGYQVFGYCNGLKSVHLSENLTTIESSMFLRCFKLQELDIPSSVTLVKSSAIDECTSLKKLKIGDKDATPGSTMIESYVLRECYSLDVLELGANIDSIGRICFLDVDSLKTVICWSLTPPRCNDSWQTFNPAPNRLNATLYVPKESLEAYRTANEWKKFNTIVPIEDVGDVNGNGMIDIADVTELIDQLLTGEFTNIPYSDIDLDGSITISDVTELIDRLLSGN